MNIKIEINDIKETYNKYNKDEINKELDNYIMEICTYNIMKKKSIKLEVYGIINEIDQETFTKLIHKHYSEELRFNTKMDKIFDYVHITLLILGILLIIISEYLISFLSELLLIAGWVVIWELIEDRIFNEIKRRKTVNIYKKLSKCIIEYKK